MPASDLALLKRWVRDGDAEAFEEIVSRHVAMVYATCKRVLRNSPGAEDVAQECFAALARGDNGPTANVAAWLHAVATRRAVDCVRGNARRRGREARFAAARDMQTEVAWDDVSGFVDEAIAALPEKLRVPIVAHFLEGRSHGAIAEAAGVSRQTITRRIGRGIEGIRRTLRKQGIEVAACTVAAMMTAGLDEATLVPVSLTSALRDVACLRAAPTGGSAAASAGGTFGAKWLVIAALVAAGVAGLWAISQRGRFDVVEPVAELKSAYVDDALPEETVAEPARTPELPLREEEPTEVYAPIGGDIYGETADAATGEPILGVTVALSGAVEAAVRSDSSGAFRFPDLPAGHYLVSAHDPIWAMAGKPLAVWLREYESAHLRLPMVRGGVVTGRVADANTGEGIPDVELKATECLFARHNREGIKTDARGDYRIGGLVDQEYVIDIIGDSNGAYVPLPLPDGRLRVQGGPYRARLWVTPGTDHKVDFQLDMLTYSEIEGLVLDLSGRPVPAAPILISRQSRPWAFGTSDQAGTFGISAADLRYRAYVQVEGEGYTSDRLGPFDIPERGLRGLTLTVYPTGSVSGVVLDETGKPVPDVEVELYDAGSLGSLLSTVRSCADNAGRFRFDGLAAGDYALWAAIARDAMINEILGGGGMALTPENVNDTLTRWGAKAPVTRIALGRSEDVNGLVVRRLGNQSIHISGRVVDTQGTPIDNFTFGARGPMDATDDEYDPSRWYEFNDLLVRDARTDAAGRFRISGLRKGAYAITADRPGFERVRLTGVRAGAEDLEIVLSRIGEIEGRVVDAVTGRAVRQFVLTTKHPDQDVQPSQAVREAKSINYAEDGRFRMASRSNGATRLWVFADGYAAKNMLLHVVSEEVLGGVIVRLEPLAGVSGRVIDAAGNPVSGAAIFVGAVPADHGVFFSYRAVARSQSDGSFQIPYEGMTPGLISAIHPGYARAAVSVELNRTEPAHVELVLDPGGTVEGIVTASRGLVVLLRVPGDEGVGLLRTETDAGGRYRFEHVPPGLVEVILVEGWNNKYQCEAVVASAETTVVDFEVHDGACVLSGAVTTRGEPVDRGRIFVSTTVDEATNTRVATIEEGQYFIEDLPSGQAHVRVFSDRDPSAGMKEAWVDLDPDQETVLNADFSGSGTLVGHVAGHGEEEQVAVLALPGKGDVGDVALTDPDRILEPRLARTDPEGAFRIHPMEPGTYTVFVRAFDREPAFSEGRFSQYTKQAVAVVEILDGTPCEVALTLR